MQETPFQVLEVRAADGERPVTITTAVTADACVAIFAALSEELDRRRAERLTTAEELLALRAQVALAERFEPLAASGTHAVIPLSQAELCACLLELTGYVERVDGEHYQPPDMRERLQVIALITPVLWDANAAAAAAAAAGEPEPLRGAAS